MLPLAHTQDDCDLVARVLAGEAEAFRVLVERYQLGVLRIARSLGPRGGGHEDLAQDVFVAAFVALRGFDPSKGAFSSWLYTIARNRSLNARKRKVLLVAGEPDDAAAPRSGEHEVFSRELRRVLDCALDELPEEQRTAFVLEELVGLGSEEIAAIEGVSSGTIRSRLSRAKARLREALATWEGGVRDER